MGILKVLFLFCFITLMPCAQGNAAEQFPFLAVVKGNNVNVRAGGNTNFEKLDRLQQGQPVVVVGKSYQWYKIQLLASAKVYIRADYLEAREAGVAEVIGDRVNVRAGAGSDYSSLGQLKKGEYVKTVEFKNGWYRIEPTATLAGFVFEDLVEFKSQSIPAGLIVAPIKPLGGQQVVKEDVALPKGQERQIIKMRGKVEPPDAKDGLFKIVVDGKTAGYVQEFPFTETFLKTTVDIEGYADPIAPMRSQLPVLAIAKIVLVL